MSARSGSRPTSRSASRTLPTPDIEAPPLPPSVEEQLRADIKALEEKNRVLTTRLAPYEKMHIEFDAKTEYDLWKLLEDGKAFSALTSILELLNELFDLLLLFALFAFAWWLGTLSAFFLTLTLVGRVALVAKLAPQVDKGEGENQYGRKIKTEDKRFLFWSSAAVFLLSRDDP